MANLSNRQVLVSTVFNKLIIVFISYVIYESKEINANLFCFPHCTYSAYEQTTSTINNK